MESIIQEIEESAAHDVALWQKIKGFSFVCEHIFEAHCSFDNYGIFFFERNK